jgi:phosphosulfolactate synthase (CoM biosynthesis protein A)
MELNQDFKEFIELLNSNEVKYIVVGGYAVGFHGYPRYTGDIDLWIAISKENTERFVNELKKFGFAALALIPEDF